MSPSARVAAVDEAAAHVTPQDALALLSALGSGMVGGVFFAFSTFVMKALSQLPTGAGITTMQRINVVVLNPLFLGTFLGTAVLSTVCIVASFVSWKALGSPLLLSGGLLYLVGSFAVTAACNVPRNDALARLDPRSAEAPAAWGLYVREWTRWNHVRTVASLAAAACFAMSLTI